VVLLLVELSIPVNNLRRGENEQPLISECYKEVTPLGHLIQSGKSALAFNDTCESLFCEAGVTFDEGRQINGAEDHNEKLKIFPRKNENQ
jgi:hypothetical protein